MPPAKRSRSKGPAQEEQPVTPPENTEAPQDQLNAVIVMATPQANGDQDVAIQVSGDIRPTEVPWYLRTALEKVWPERKG